MQKSMRIIAFWAIISLLPITLHSQKMSYCKDKTATASETLASQAGPYEVATFVLPSVNNQDLQHQEKTKDKHQEIPHFAHPFYVDIRPLTHGNWHNLDNGYLLWTLQIHSSQAHSINLGFAEYLLAGNTRLNIYDVHTDQFLGSYSALDNDAHKQLFTPILETDFIRLELIVQPRYKPLIRLRLQQVNHAFIDFNQKKLSDNCHIDINCGAGDNLPEVDAYRNQINSVGLITVNGIGFCTGVLINNTSNDFKPYFLTAEHCGIKSNTAPSVVVYWGFHNSTCRPIDSAENAAEGDGDLNIANSGAQLRAFFNPSDMTLLELDDPVPSQADAFFAGWNRTWDESSTVAVIHHPNGEEKRISIDRDTVKRSNHFSEPMPNGNHWRVENWELGSTESGSSGAPLFDATGKIIGQLHGGTAACGEGGSDWFGALATSWDGGGAPQTQLKNWLDAANFQPTQLEGIPLEIVNPLAAGAVVLSELNCFGDANASVEVQAFGGVPPYEYSQDGLVFGANSVFENLESGEYLFFVLDAFGNLVASPTVTIEAVSALDLNPDLQGNDLFVNVTGGTAPYQYSLDGENFQTNHIFTFWEQGPQMVYVKDANHCMDSTEVAIAWTPMTVGHRVVAEIPCHGDSLGVFELIIDDGIAPYGVFLNDVFQEEQTFLNQGAGSYDFVIIDSSLDTILYSIDLLQPSPISIVLESAEDRIEVEATGGTGMYQYSLDNVVFQNEHFFENLGNGTYEVFVKDENECLISDTISVFLLALTNIDKQQVEIYPNPTADELHFSFKNENLPFQTIQIYDVQGQMIWEEKINPDFSKIMNIKNWSSGTYFVHIQGNSFSEIHQVTKK